MIKTFEAFNELDPYGEEDWGKETIVWKIECSNDTVYGYVKAETREEARQMALDDGIVPPYLQDLQNRYRWGPNKLEKDHYELELESLKKEYEWIGSKYNNLKNLIEKK